ncbi:hypothetical protein ACHHYP_03291 [Achlya hypogyna]|uniref:Kinetochore protein SPC25 n=1 Tax=Achlya hypogyna TaxID=1202772 RepID=A0A1V9ZRF3_ACHHY|nr:hypothetical protein ACHHYP_03291 [Achlya hypogyna]
MDNFVDPPLDQHLEAADRAVAEWAEMEKRQCDDAQRACAADVSKDEQELRSLMQRRAHLLASVKEADGSREQQKRMIHGSEHEVRALQTEILKVEPAVDRLKSREKLHVGNLTKFNQEREKAAQTHQSVVDELMKGIHMYQKLGLGITEVGENHLGFVFTQIDPSNHDREFSFSLRVHQDAFVVETCSPEVADVPALLDALNSTNNISFFVRSMRQRFKSLI